MPQKIKTGIEFQIGDQMLDPKLLDIKEYQGIGYMPLIEYDRWRVAVLRFIDDLLPENIHSMQRHMETDEVFVLLKGQCILFIGVGNDLITEIHPQVMEAEKVYNVKKACWHTHILSKDAMVLIVENRDTGEQNSQEIPLSESQRRQLFQWLKFLLVSE
jgi:hypothetical protein